MDQQPYVKETKCRIYVLACRSSHFQKDFYLKFSSNIAMRTWNLPKTYFVGIFYSLKSCGHAMLQGPLQNGAAILDSLGTRTTQLLVMLITE